MRTQLLVVLVCGLGRAGAVQEHNWVEAPLRLADSPRHSRHMSGHDIVLNCPVDVRTRPKTKVYWEVKRDGELQYGAASGRWSPTKCRGCRAELVLRNASESDSGTYRCCIKHSAAVAAFSVEVVDVSKPPGEPKVTPTNLTVLEGEPAMLHCRVSSRRYVELRWLCLQDSAANSSQHIHYMGASYKPLKSTGQVLRPEGYYTKLSLALTSTGDSGYYVCVALGAMHHSIGGTYLFVLPRTTPGSSLEPADDAWHLHLLFLIPAALALLPAVVWLSCLCRCRRHCGRSPPPHTKYQPVVSTSTTPRVHASGTECATNIDPR